MTARKKAKKTAPTPERPKESTQPSVTPGSTFSVTLTLSAHPPKFHAMSRGAEVPVPPDQIQDLAFWKRTLQPTRDRVGSRDMELRILAVNAVDVVGV